MRFFYTNKIDISSLSASSEVDGFPAVNLKNPHRTRAWKTTGNATLADEYVEIADDGTTRTHVILLDHNIFNYDTLKIQGNSVPVWTGTPPFSETIAVTVPPGQVLWSTLYQFAGGPQTYPYWRLVWTKNLASQAYSMGRLFLGTYHQPEQPPDYDGVRRGYRDRSITQESYGGQVYSLHRQAVRSWQIAFSRFSETQKEAFRTVADSVGTYKPFFVQIHETGSGEYIEPLYVRFTRPPAFGLAGYDSSLRYDTTLELEESL